MLLLQPKTKIVLRHHSSSSVLFDELFTTSVYKVSHVTSDTMQLAETINGTAHTDTKGETFKVPITLLPFFKEV